MACCQKSHSVIRQTNGRKGMNLKVSDRHLEISKLEIRLKVE